jgi:hypothetical protein
MVSTVTCISSQHDSCTKGGILRKKGEVERDRGRRESILYCLELLSFFPDRFKESEQFPLLVRGVFKSHCKKNIQK